MFIEDGSYGSIFNVHFLSFRTKSISKSDGRAVCFGRIVSSNDSKIVMFRHLTNPLTKSNFVCVRVFCLWLYTANWA